MKIDNRHTAIVMANGVWYAVREIEIADLTVPRLDAPLNHELTVRLQFKGELKAADRITVPLTLEDAGLYNLTKERLAEINEDVILQNYLPVLEAA